MYKLLFITNRNLCKDNFVERVRDIIDLGYPVILREKDLTEVEYFELLEKINRKDIIAHTYINAAKRFGCKSIHLPITLLEHSDVSCFKCVGASTHSIEQAEAAKRLGADYITAGHIFETDCKKGIEPKGVSLIKSIKKSINISVFALGGINNENANKTIYAGADGIAIMSGIMQCDNVKKYIDRFVKKD